MRIFSRAERISSGASSAAPALAALSTAARETATSAVAGVFRLEQPVIRTIAVAQAASAVKGVLMESRFVIFLLLENVGE